MLGRDLPDVATVAGDVYSVAAGQSQIQGGTSVATPLWAAFISLVNQNRRATVPGSWQDGAFLNPVLYYILANGNFHDVTYGNNGIGACAGFNAGAGY